MSDRIEEVFRKHCGRLLHDKEYYLNLDEFCAAVAEILRERDKQKSVRDQLNEMFGKKDVDYAIKEADTQRESER